MFEKCIYINNASELDKFTVIHLSIGIIQ